MAKKVDSQLFKTHEETYDIPENLDSEPEEKIILNIEEEKPDGFLLAGNLDNSENQNALVRAYKKFNLFLVSHSKVKAKDKATFFHLLSVMINAGIPMVKALNSLAVQLAKSNRLQIIIKEMKESIENGGSLSAAMKAYPDVFVEAEIGMVKSGEASGQLTKVLRNLAKDAEKSYMIRSKVKGAMIYPSVILTLLIVVLIAMMIFVIPKMETLFLASGGKLPLITRIVIGFSNFIIDYGILILFLVFVTSFGIILAKKTAQGKYFFDSLKLKIPIFGKLLKKYYLARFARSLSNLIDSDVSIITAIEITAGSIGNNVYKKRLLLACEDIKQGLPLAENLTASPLFPPMLVNMIDVGEQTAQMGEICDKIARFYEQEVDNTVAGISKIIEPILLVIIGLSVGVLIAAIMLPIMKLTDLTSSF